MFILFWFIDCSSQTANLARHLSPAFVRIQGFSTPEIRFSQHVEEVLPAPGRRGFGRVNLTVTPSMLTSLNGWLISANLTPVFALSDRDRVNDAWNPESAALPLMAIADKMNMTCFWELNNGETITSPTLPHDLTVSDYQSLVRLSALLP